MLLLLFPWKVQFIVYLFQKKYLKMLFAKVSKTVTWVVTKTGISGYHRESNIGLPETEQS